MSELFTDLKIVDNVFVKLHYFKKAGDTHEGHRHNFDHITLLASGSVRMIRGDEELEYIAPCLIVTPKGVEHQFTALSDHTVFCCIHAIRERNELDAIADPNITLEEAWELISEVPLTDIK